MDEIEQNRVHGMLNDIDSVGSDELGGISDENISETEDCLLGNGRNETERELGTHFTISLKNVFCGVKMKFTYIVTLCTKMYVFLKKNYLLRNYINKRLVYNYFFQLAFQS